MTKIKQAKRRQRLPDAAFIQASRTKMAFFIKDKAAFIAFDSDFADPFATNWQGQVDAAEAQPTRQNLNAISTQLTDAVEQQMKHCRAKFTDAKHYIKKAFTQNPVMLDAFGYSNFRQARKVPHLMISFMNVLARACDLNRAQLNAIGYSNDDIAEIETLETALSEINLTQQIFISSIPEATHQRIATFNTAHSTIERVCKAGKTIFKNNPAKRRQYLMPARIRKVKGKRK